MRSHHPPPSLHASKAFLWSFLTNRIPSLKSPQPLYNWPVTPLQATEALFPLSSLQDPGHSRTRSWGTIQHRSCVSLWLNPLLQPRCDRIPRTRWNSLVYFIITFTTFEAGEFPPPCAVTSFNPKRSSEAPANQAGTKLGKRCLPICRLESRCSHPQLLRVGGREHCSLGRELQAAWTCPVFLSSSLCIWHHNCFIHKASGSRIFPASEAVQ